MVVSCIDNPNQEMELKRHSTMTLQSFTCQYIVMMMVISIHRGVVEMQTSVEKGKVLAGNPPHSYLKTHDFPNFIRNVNIPWPCGGMGDGDYLHIFDEIVIPIGREFGPDLVISGSTDAFQRLWLTFQFLPASTPRTATQLETVRSPHLVMLT
jgi:hypothetical protein